jgi:hypothetical protein
MRLRRGDGGWVLGDRGCKCFDVALLNIALNDIAHVETNVMLNEVKHLFEARCHTTREWSFAQDHKAS